MFFRKYQTLAIALTAAACNCPTPLHPIGTLAVDITSPMDQQAFGNGQSFMFTATATDLLGVASLTLTGGGDSGVTAKTLNTCKPALGAATTTDGGMTMPTSTTGSASSSLDCSFSFAINSNTDLIGSDGEIALTALALDEKGASASKTIHILIQAQTCNITAPPVTAGTNPPTAVVSGTSPLTVSVTSVVNMSDVNVVADNKTPPLQNWTAPMGPYTAMQNWGPLGFGTHTLVATCKDINGNLATSKLLVQVKCTSDADCTNGERCCSNDGTCNPTVAPGSDCSCDQPCPVTQGCFPGVCGAAPAKCYDGCFPGCPNPNDSSECTGYPGGKLPMTCPNVTIDGVSQPAFCNPLPTDQVTPQNQGGACIVGDGCSVTAQNCPSLPLDRSQPQSATNPLVAYNCLPVAPNLNGCFPAGNTAVGGTNCNQACGSVAAGTAGVANNCKAGSECVQPVDGNGKPLGPASCEQQCSDPTTTGEPSAGCPSNETCTGVYEPYGSQKLNFTTGSCCLGEEERCTTANQTECCSGECEDGICL